MKKHVDAIFLCTAFVAGSLFAILAPDSPSFSVLRVIIAVATMITIIVLHNKVKGK